MSERSDSDVSYIDIAPTSLVQVSRTDFISPTLTTIVSDLGGAMGIWLGMGVTQLIHHSVDIITQILGKIGQTMGQARTDYRTD